MTAPLLSIENVWLRYGAVEALRGIDLSIAQGEIVTLLGANGAGKTSLLRAISGLVRITQGRIVLDGRAIQHDLPHEIVAMGLTHCPEGRRIFPEMTVEENLQLGGMVLREEKKIQAGMEQAYRLFPVLSERRCQKAGTLSGGEQQMLALARAFISQPKLMLLDEPSLGLAPLFVDQIFSMMTELNRNHGLTIFLVEQNAREALLHSHRAYVLETGRIVLEGEASKLLHDPRVIDAYLGG